MAELLETYWYLIVAALLVGVLVAWWIFAGSRRARVLRDESPPADSAPRRNQALIDSPPPAAMPVVPPVPGGLAGAGEAVAAAATPDAMTAAVADDDKGEAGAEPADDVTRIKGLGPKLAEQLRALGVTRLSQIAAWSDADVERIDAQLGRFQGRIRRDDWIGQAKLLSSGDTAAYEAKFGKL